MDRQEPSSGIVFDAEAFGANVLARLKRDGMTFRQAAPLIPISPATLNRVANGKTPDVQTFLRLIRWLEQPDAPILTQDGEG